MRMMVHRLGWVGWSKHWGLCPLLDALRRMKDEFYDGANCTGNDEGHGKICKAFFDVFVVGMRDQ